LAREAALSFAYRPAGSGWNMGALYVTCALMVVVLAAVVLVALVRRRRA
jgi:hypothetical protein